MVALRDPLWHEIAEHDEQDQVKRFQGAEFSPARDAGDEEDEEEDDGGSDDEVHGYGKMVREWCTRVIMVAPSSSSTSSRRLPTWVGLTWKYSQTTRPAACVRRRACCREDDPPVFVGLAAGVGRHGVFAH